MPRRERPLDVGDSPLLRLAADLRLLRQKAGSPTYRELARLAHYSVATLSAAAAGTRLPSLSVTVAYARACGGDPGEWTARWHAVAAELAAAEAAARSGSAPLNGSEGPYRAGESGGRERDGYGPAEGPGGIGAPYVGLSAFGTEDAERFFGRERLLDELTRRLDQRRFVAVVGASGAGKSSLLRAGLVPHRQSAFPGHPVVLLTPGPHPLEECATRLSALTGVAPGTLALDFAGHARALHLAVRQAVAPLPGTAELLLVVDQFEEVFTLCQDVEERARFIDALITAVSAENSRCRLVVGVRADFYAHCTDHPELGRALSEAQILVGPMTTDELRRAITQPAVRAGYQVEGALVADLVGQAKGQAAVLPLLSHALLETWHRRHGTTLTLTGFQATGGIDGGLAHTAEQLYATLEPAQRRAARNLLLRLTALGEGTEDTKRRVSRTEPDLPAGTEPPAGAPADTALVLERFARARLLTLDRDTIEITHEALIRCWPRLRGWLLEDREGLRIHRDLTEAAEVWESVQRDPGALYRGVRLARARQWAVGQGAEPGGERGRSDDGEGGTGESGSVLSSREAAFLAAGVAAQVAEEAAATRRTRRLRHLALLLAVLLAGTVAATGFAVRAERQATRQRDIAVSQRVAGEAAALRVTDPARALQLGLGAYRLNPTVAARSTLLSSYATPYATQLTHGDRVEAVAYRPGGRMLATAGVDRVVRLWDVTDPYRPRAAASFTGHTATLRSVAFSPDGRLLASAGDDGTVRLWRVPSAAGPLARVPAARVPAARVPAARDTAEPSAVLVSATGRKGPAALLSVAFAPDGRTVAAAASDGTVRLWPTARRGRVVARSLPGVQQDLRAVTFGPGGRTLATAGYGGAVLWDLTRTPARVLGRTGHRPGAHVRPALPVDHAVVFSPDGRTLATAGDDHAVRLWSVADARRPHSRAVLTGHTDTVQALAFARDGRTLASGGIDSTVRLWNVADPAHSGPLATLTGHTGDVTSLAFGPDGRTLASASGDHTARTWDLFGPALVGHTSSVYAVGFSPDGRTAATGGYDRTVRLWDVEDPYRPRALAVLTRHTEAVNEVAFSARGHVLATASLDRTVRLWNVTDPRRPRALAVLTGDGDAVNSVAFSPDGRTLATGGGDRTVRLWDTTDARRPRRLVVLDAHRDQVEAVAFSPDGKTLASGGRDRAVRLWDVTDAARPRALARLTGHTDAVKAVAFSPRGHVLATAGDDRSVRLWDLTDRRRPTMTAAPGGYADGLKALAFSPDGRTLAAGSADRTARLWRVDDPRHPAELAVLTGHTKPVDAVAFAPDGHTLMTGGEDWNALLWDMDADRVAGRVCRTSGRHGLTRADLRQYLPDLSHGQPCPAAAR